MTTLVPNLMTLAFTQINIFDAKMDALLLESLF